MKKFYQIVQRPEERAADIYIYGTITSNAEIVDAIFDTETGAKSAHGIIAEIEGLDVDVINVYINSYGGEVAEALAIYTALRRHPASVHTFCDGFACSAASVVFVAGDQRTMGQLALLMIHNASTIPERGTAEDLRKAAEDLEKITEASVGAYLLVCPDMAHDEIKALMDKETWINAEEAVNYGFATDVADEAEDDQPTQSAISAVHQAVMAGRGIEELAAKYESLQDAVISLAICVAELKAESKAAEKQRERDFPEEPKPAEPVEEHVKISFYSRYLKR